MTDNILIVTATPAPDGQQEMGKYLTSVMPVLQGAGGQLISRAKSAKQSTGKPGSQW